MGPTLTLDEAAAQLGISTSEFKRRLQTEWKELRPFRDGSTLRFKRNDIEEIGRKLGMSSEPELQLSPTSDTDDLLLPMESSLTGEEDVGHQTVMQIMLPPVPESPAKGKQTMLPGQTPKGKETMLPGLTPPSKSTMIGESGHPRTEESLELPLGQSGSAVTDDLTVDLNQFDFAGLTEEIPPPPQKSAPKTQVAPPKSDEILFLPDSDDFFLSPDATAVTQKPTPPKTSFAPRKETMLPGLGQSASDSDIRLEGSPPKKPASNDDDDSIMTEEIISLPSPVSGVLKSGGSGKKIPTPPGSSSRLAGLSGKGKAPVPPKKPVVAQDDSSEFELSLDVDSDEFELSLNNDSGDSDIGELPKSSNRVSGQSGINLNKPNDSGLSLEKKGKKKAPEPDGDDEIDFELSLDTPGVGISGRNLGSRSSKNIIDSDSEFELSLDDVSGVGDLDADTSSINDNSGKEDQDIFETDFQMPAMDESSSEAVPLDAGDTDLESSEFDLALDESDVSVDSDSSSQAVGLDDDDDAPRKPRKKGSSRTASVEDDQVSFDDMEMESGSSASAALRGVDLDDEENTGRSTRIQTKTVVVQATPAPWGALPTVMLLPAVFIMFLAGIMGYELVRGMWGYSQSSRPTSTLLDSVSNAFGIKPVE